MFIMSNVELKYLDLCVSCTGEYEHDLTVKSICEMQSLRLEYLSLQIPFIQLVSMWGKIFATTSEIRVSIPPLLEIRT